MTIEPDDVDRRLNQRQWECRRVVTRLQLATAVDPFSLSALEEEFARGDVARVAKRKGIIWPSVVIDGWASSDRFDGREFLIRGEAWTRNAR